MVSDSFQKQGIVNSDFEKRLYQREKMSSTAFGRIAIPHSLDMASNKVEDTLLSIHVALSGVMIMKFIW